MEEMVPDAFMYKRSKGELNAVYANQYMHFHIRMSLITTYMTLMTFNLPRQCIQGHYNKALYYTELDLNSVLSKQASNVI